MKKKNGESFLLSLDVELLQQFLDHRGWAEVEKILDKEAGKFQDKVNMPIENESDAYARNTDIGRMEGLGRVRPLIQHYVKMHDIAAERAAERAVKQTVSKTSAQKRGTEQSSE